MDAAAMEDCTQRAEWRTRILVAVATGSFDTETLIAMLDAGWDQAHSEGLKDAAEICDGVAASLDDPPRKKVATTLADACRELDARNRDSRAAGQTPL